MVTFFSFAAAFACPTALSTPAVMDLVRQKGAKAVTMRAIANELGVKAASLYYHVRDKDALFDLVLRHVATTLGPSIVEQFGSVLTLDEWIDVSRRTTLEAYDFHEQHPGIAALMLSRAFNRPDAASLGLSHIAFAEADALVRVGLPQPTAYRVYQTCARWSLAAIAAETDNPGNDRAVGRAFFTDGYELFLTAIRHLVDNQPSS